MKKYFWNQEHHTPITLFFIVIFLLTNFIFLASLVKNNMKSSVKSNFGVTFSKTHSESLGLDWKQNYLALMDDLHVRYFRIPAYWNQIEFNKDEYSYDYLDFIVDEAEKRDAKIILAIGNRVPRWPECHTPAWAAELNKEKQEEQILELVGNLVERYKNRKSIVEWQVENEYFLSFFGECPKSDIQFFKKEIDLVRYLDKTRPIMTTDSGELSMWYQASSLVDELGVSMYRITWNDIFGSFYYPLTPRYYQNKAFYAKFFVNRVIISELQAEPWGDKPTPQMTLEEQYKTMNVNIFRDNVDFARRTGFEEVYLWGAEWWYMLKSQGHPEMWEEARKVFANN